MYTLIKDNHESLKSVDNGKEAVSKHPHYQNLGGISCLMNG